MDTIKLKSSCVCGNARPYLECCGAYSEKPDGDLNRLHLSSDAKTLAYHFFRHQMHEVFVSLLSLRDLYQSYWARMAEDEYPHELLMEDSEYGRVMVESFFWDFFSRYSESRPLIRVARHLELEDLRMSQELRTWSMVPLWAYKVEQVGSAGVLVRNLGNEKSHLLHPMSLPSEIEPGMGLVTRVLPFQGFEFAGCASLMFSPGEGMAFLRGEFRNLCYANNLRPGVSLRPDVHSNEWPEHARQFLRIWRRFHYDRVLGRPDRKKLRPVRLEVMVRDGDELSRKLLETPGIRLMRNRRFELRHRVLRVSEITVFESAVVAVLTDSVFETYLCQWMAEHLGDFVPVELLSSTGRSESAKDRIDPVGQPDRWLESSCDELNGETPNDARKHDFGRKRLREILEMMEVEGVDIAYLRQRLEI